MYLRSLSVLALLIAGSLFVLNQYFSRPALPSATQILSPAVQKSKFWLNRLHLGTDGQVYGAKADALYTIEEDGSKTKFLYRFKQPITGIHQRKDGLLIVATDEDYWDATKPCYVYRSSDNGQTFERIKTIEQGAAIWWSISSDRAGRIYLAEYGPQQKGMSKTLWRSDDNGDTWVSIYQAPDENKIHLHRVAVDPYTDTIWLTLGDGKHRAMLKSVDHGSNWQHVARLQATAVAFGPKAIYWGKDEKGSSGVLRYDRQTEQFDDYFMPRKFGNYGGSIYDLLRLDSGELIVPFMKYADQSHLASVWRGKDDIWAPLLQLAGQTGIGSGLPTIAGPDLDGWVYLPGYQIKLE